MLRVFAAGTIAILAVAARGNGSEGVDPFAFFAPSAAVHSDDRDVLLRGGTIARVVPGSAHVVAVFSATAVYADGDRLLAWMRDISAFKKSDYVGAMGRFSDPPRLGDLAALTLDPADVDDVRNCRPGRCAIKLAAAEIDGLQRAGDMQDAFRRIVLRRVESYLKSGEAGLPTYDDHGTAVSLQAHFAGLLQQSSFLRERLPNIAGALERWPAASPRGVESFLYWSKETFGRKPVISVSHVTLVRGNGTDLPEAVAISRQVFATHYMDASLGVTAIVRDPSGAQRYLEYLNRSDVDVLGGMWGGLVRRILERRVRSEAPAVLKVLRHRLESGDPPRTPSGMFQP